MRELVIVIPDLYLPAREGPPRRMDESPRTATFLPGLEHIARFGKRTRLGSGWRAWLAESVGRGDLARAAPASVAAVASAPGARAETADRTWMASPLHLEAGLTTLHVDRRSLLRLSRGELQELCADFDCVFGGSLRLEPLASGEALLHSSEAAQAKTVEPARFLDGDVAAALPEGPGSGFLRRLGAEIEMWLHEHPVNRARIIRRDLPVSTLWLWGGKSDATLPDIVVASGHAAAKTLYGFGTDAYLQGLSRLQGFECRPLPDSLDGVVGAPGGSLAAGVQTSIVAVNVGQLWSEGENFLDALQELDRRFLEPAGRAVRAGSFRQVSVLANDRLAVLGGRDHLRLWRRRSVGIEGLRWS